MDPSAAQSDKGNDTHSLEHEGEGGAGLQSTKTESSAAQAPKSEDGITDATGGAKTVAQNPFQHRSFVRRLWDKFNIYLLLFALVLVIAIGSVVGLTLKSKQDAVKLISSQELTEETLKDLANTDLSVGAPRQILTVQANAVFAGAVLIRGDLDVAGSLKLGGGLELVDLNVGGNAKLNEATATNLTVSSNLNVQGTLTLKSGISVGGASNFNAGLTASSITTGVLNLNGDLKLTHHITAGGTIPDVSKGTAVGGGGTVSLSGSDTAGTVAVNTGSSPPAGCFATVTFSEQFDNTPHVVVTPVGAAAAGIDYYITRSTTSFIICSTNSAPSGQNFAFDYVVLD
jgi:hypothetical protein